MIEYTDNLYWKFHPVIKNQIRLSRVSDFIPYADCMQEGNLVFLNALASFNQNYYQFFGLYLKRSLKWRFYHIIRKQIRWGSVEQAMSLDAPITSKVDETFLEKLEDMTRDVEFTFFADVQLADLQKAMQGTVYEEIHELMNEEYSQKDIGILLKMSQSSVSRRVAFIKEATELYFRDGILLRFEEI